MTTKTASGLVHSTPTAWAHLPNARHIDRILQDLNARPDVWDAAWNAAWNAARNAAWDATWNAARNAAWDATRNAAWAAARTAARDAARALIAWDDVAYILDLKPDGCRMLIEMCADHHKHAAVLLLPAVIALHT